MIFIINSLSFEYWKIECSLSRDGLVAPVKHFSLSGHFQASQLLIYMSLDLWCFSADTKSGTDSVSTSASTLLTTV